jgi:hypothetical protein
MNGNNVPYIETIPKRRLEKLSSNSFVFVVNFISLGNECPNNEIAGPNHNA